MRNVKADFEHWASEYIGQFNKSGHYGTLGTWIYNNHFQQKMWECWQSAYGVYGRNMERLIRENIELRKANEPVYLKQY
jgi:hypothetical protein